MNHLILLGDSIFDNATYCAPGPAVITQVRAALPSWRATLAAVDGSVSAMIPAQIARLPADATHLVLSVGGNDALGAAHLLNAPVATVADALNLLGSHVDGFRAHYAAAIAAATATGLPLLVCTVYNGRFPDAALRKIAATALSLFNDVIQTTARRNGLDVLELREICDDDADFANPIEPSSVGGAKIAAAIGGWAKQVSPRM